MSPHTPKWTSTLGVGILMESLRSPEFLKNDFKGWKSLDWRHPYTIEKLLRHRCIKWACMIHLNTYNTSFGRKKSQKLKCQIDFWPLTVGNHPNLNVFRGHVTYHWNALDKGYNFALDLTNYIRSYKKLWASRKVRIQSREFPNLGIRGKMTFGCNPNG
jgi:hypothetical protein